MGRKLLGGVAVATLLLLGQVLTQAQSTGRRGPPAREASAPDGLDPSIERALSAASVEREGAIAAFIEALASGSPNQEVDLGTLREDPRLRAALIQAVARHFPAVIDSAVFRTAYERRRADFRSQYASRPGIDATVERWFPADPRQLVADRIRDLDRECADVDFRAATRRDPEGRVFFVDPDNEARPRLWKLCFRFGKKNMTEIRRATSRYRAYLERGGVRPRENL